VQFHITVSKAEGLRQNRYLSEIRRWR